MYYEILKEILANCDRDKFVITYALEAKIREEVKRLEEERNGK